jgi:uncharacterized protein YdeI (YjbR/CyaY-like superfamily)
MAFRAGRRRMSDAASKSAAQFFETAQDFRAWLEQNHDTHDELWVGIRKKASGLPSVTYKEAVDVGLCFGWIDGVMNGIDETSYRQRFTPRRKGSIWSAVNIARVEELTRLGLMHPAGLAAYQNRDPAKANLYSFEQGDISLTGEQEALFRANEKAWEFFQTQPISYRKPAIWWVISAKRDETRQRRLATLIADSEAGRRLAHLVSPAKRKPA